MNQETKEMVDRISRDVEKFIPHYYCEDSWYSCPKDQWGCADDTKKEDQCYCGAEKERELLAKYILCKELEARIEELEQLPTGYFDSTPYKQKAIENIKAQLKELTE